MSEHMIPVTEGGGAPVPAGARAVSPVPFRRLVAVEARKLVDTRSGLILAALLVGLTVESVVARGVVVGPRALTVLGTAGIGLGTLLPVLGILTVTAEWTHHTALTTFALEPRRMRVLAAKCLPPLIAAVAASLLALLAAVLVTAVVAEVRHVPATWDISPLVLLGWTGANVLVVAEGLALGMLLMNAPAAIVVCLAGPLMWGIVARLGTAGEVLAGWLDLNATAAPLASADMTGGDLARLAVSVAFWIAAPTAAGLTRAVRREVA
ncbi:ABC transporter permease [Microtetraspora malaysiensis]|uniref:ABC transporter permease n=1 Tax=Microtetraspora malaysiensis TaxID=161358 RepID=UPI003D9094C8